MEYTITHISESARERAAAIVKNMTLREKAILHEGDAGWFTNKFKTVNLRAWRMSDGPHGLRKKRDVSLPRYAGNTTPATCFPPAVTTSCAFDTDLTYEMGQTLGEECLWECVDVLLGPAANIKRSPLCGRNFEYISEDPLVAGKYASALINGVQSKNVGTSLKHFLANNQEASRFRSNSKIDERALREIYMRAFEYAVKHAQPWTVMCSYNKINGEYAASNKRFMTDILRGEWGFEGMVISDWGAMSDRPQSVRAGIDLEMPQPPVGFFEDIIDAVNRGELSEEQLNTYAERIAAIAVQTQDNKCEPYDEKKHDAVSRRIARESAVLLENDGLLPLKKDKHYAVLGAFAEQPRYQGSGSSQIVLTHLNSPLDEFERQGVKYTYSEAYDTESDVINPTKHIAAVETAKESDAVIIFAGLPDMYESEGYDRTHMRLPKSHLALIRDVVRTGNPVVVVLMCGSSVELPWRKDVNALLLMNLAGQNVGGAAYDLLFGEFSPCGKLTETFPLALSDVPSRFTFGKPGNVEYLESIFVGYRYYDTAHAEVAYPFGYGLSYTTFEYTNPRLSKAAITDKDTLTVTVTVKNTGDMAAKEIVQLYVAPPASKVFKPVHELRAYSKVKLMPGEAKDVSFELDASAFAYYNVDFKDWHAESGDYVIELAASSRDIRQKISVHVSSTKNYTVPDYRKTAPAYYALETNRANIPLEHFLEIYRRTPCADMTTDNYPNTTKPFTKTSTPRELIARGGISKDVIMEILAPIYDKYKDASAEKLRQVETEILDRPLNSSIFAPTALTPEQLSDIVDRANGKKR